MAEQIPLIEASALPVSREVMPPTDLYLLIAWYPFRSTVAPYKLQPNVRAKVEHFADLSAAEMAGRELDAHWTGRCIAHVVIGGDQ